MSKTEVDKEFTLELELEYTRNSFVALLQDQNKRTAFKEFLEKNEKPRESIIRLFRFMDLYWRLQNTLLECATIDGPKTEMPRIKYDGPLIIPKDHTVFQRFLTLQVRANIDLLLTDKNQPRKKISLEITSHLLRFYCTFIITEAPELVECISDYARMQTARNLSNVIFKNSIECSVFDYTMIEALSYIYTTYFGKYLAFSGINAVEEIVAVASPNRAKKFDGNLEGVKKEKSKGFFSLFRKVSNKPKKHPLARLPIRHLIYTRECFIQAHHCSEMILFYVTFIKLEGRLDRSTPGWIDRFLAKDDKRKAKEPEGSFETHFIHPALVPLSYIFYTIFIAPGSMHEVNLTHTCRKTIEKDLAAANGKEIPVGVYDAAIDHVLRLLYENSYKSFASSATQSDPGTANRSVAKIPTMSDLGSESEYSNL